jgi:hypothetical protein
MVHFFEIDQEKDGNLMISLWTLIFMNLRICESSEGMEAACFRLAWQVTVRVNWFRFRDYILVIPIHFRHADTPKRFCTIRRI